MITPLRTAFATNYKFWCYIFILACSKILKFFSFWFPFWLIGYSVTCCLISTYLQFLTFFLLLIFNFILLWLQKILIWFQCFYLLRLVCGLICDLSSNMFHVHLRRVCILLLLHEMFCMCPLSSSDRKCLLIVFLLKTIFSCFPYFLIDVLSGWSIHWYKWGVKTLYFYCISVYFFTLGL